MMKKLNSTTNKETSIHPISAVVGIVFLLAGLYFVTQAISIYRQQLNERDWTVTSAEVTEVSSRRESRGSAKHRFHVTVYDISYTYDVEDNTYHNQIMGAANGKEIGDHFEIKYDPENPQRSTNILTPQTDALLFNLLFSAMFAFFGGWISGLLPFLISLARKQKK